MPDILQSMKVSTPTTDYDVANKKYVDDSHGGEVNRYVDINVCASRVQTVGVNTAYIFPVFGGHIYTADPAHQVRSAIMSDCSIVQMRMIMNSVSQNQQAIRVRIYQNDAQNIDANFVIAQGSRQSDIVGFGIPVKFYAFNYCHGIMNINGAVTPNTLSLVMRMRYPIRDILEKNKEKIKI